MGGAEPHHNEQKSDQQPRLTVEESVDHPRAGHCRDHGQAQGHQAPDGGRRVDHRCHATPKPAGDYPRRLLLQRLEEARAEQEAKCP